MAGIVERAAKFLPVALANRIFAARKTTEGPYVERERVPYRARTRAGVIVTPDTAITVAAVWACLRYLSQSVAVVPWRVMREVNDGAEIARGHHVDWLLRKRPSPEWSSFALRETLTHWALRWGNGYAEIERDSVGRPFALWPIHPERVAVCRDRDSLQLFYEVTNGTGGIVRLEPMDMFHIRGFGEGPVGVNVMAYAAESIGWARAAQLFGAAFLGNGMSQPGVLSFKGKLTESGKEEARKQFEETYKGAHNAGKVFIGDNEVEFKPTVTDPEKAQFISTNQHLVEEVCRWFGVPPHKIAHLLRSTFNNIEHQSIEVVIDSITPWVKRWEEEADYKLFGQNRPGYYTKMNLNALMRGDAKSRAEFYKTMREMGVFSANDIRRLEDLNGIGEDGEKRVMQTQYTTLERIGEDPPEPLQPTVQPADGDDDSEEAAAMAAIVSMQGELVR